MRASARTLLPRTGGPSRPAGRWAATRTALPAAALALGLLAGCAAAPGPGGPADLPGGGASDGIGGIGPNPSGNPERALARWQSFPVSASPRPLVLVSGMILGPRSGFGSGEAKEAYAAGQFELATALPTAPPTSGGYPVIAASQALDELRSVPPGGQSVSPPLKVVKVSLTQADFLTDRGLRLLPAWQFTLAGVQDSVRVLAVVRSELWPAKPSGPTAFDEKATIAADDQTLTYSFTGSPAGPSPCGVEYWGEASESQTAAVVSIGEVTPNPAGGSTPADQACNSIGAQRMVTVRLAEPLGSRVLLNSEGAPVAVVKR